MVLWKTLTETIHCCITITTTIITYNLFQENSSRELEEPHDYASMFEEQDQEGGNTGYGHANNEISIRDEPDGKNKGKGCDL